MNPSNPQCNVGRRIFRGIAPLSRQEGSVPIAAIPETPPEVPDQSSIPAPRVADAFVLCLVSLAATAAGLAGLGGRGRVLETLVMGLGCIVSFQLGWSRARYAFGLWPLLFLLLEWQYGRLAHETYWSTVALAAGVAVATFAAAYLRCGVDRRTDELGAVLDRLSGHRRLDDLEEALGADMRSVGTLAYELERARRHNHALSVLVIRPDDFDEVAMRFGDDAASQMLHTVAATVGKSLRATDIPLRQQPYDFAVILPETARTEARMVAERIRLAVAAERLEFGPGDVVDLTVSIGVAAFPQDATSNAQMTDALHHALAGAVESGGNRTVMYSVPDGSPPRWGLNRDLARS